MALWSWLKAVPGWLYGFAGALLALGAAYLRGRASGRASERQKGNEQALDHRRSADEIEREVEGLSDDDLEKRGRPWLRP